MLFRSYSVRHEFPLRATYFRQVLPHVRGFPTLRVLRLIRLPNGLRRAFPFTVLLRLPGCVFQSSASGSGIAPCPGFPLRASISVCPTTTLPTTRSLWDLPSSSTHLFLHATA